MLFAWLSQELYSITLFDLFLRGGLLVFLVFLVIRYRRQNARIKNQLLSQVAFSRLGFQLGAAASPKEAAGIIMDTAQKLLGWHASTLKLYDPAIGVVESIINLDLIEGKIVEVEPFSVEKVLSPTMQQVFKEGAKLILRPDPLVQNSSEKLVPFGD